MAVRNHLIVTAVDFLGFRSRHEMTVIATDDAEMREEIERNGTVAALPVDCPRGQWSGTAGIIVL